MTPALYTHTERLQPDASLIHTLKAFSMTPALYTHTERLQYDASLHTTTCACCEPNCATPRF